MGKRYSANMAPKQQCPSILWANTCGTSRVKVVKLKHFRSIKHDWKEVIANTKRWMIANDEIENTWVYNTRILFHDFFTFCAGSHLNQVKHFPQIQTGKPNIQCYAVRIKINAMTLRICCTSLSKKTAATWRIVPVSKWLKTMVSKSPNWGCSPSK